jgi:hypothetical protein
LRHRRKIGDLPPAFPNGWFGIIESDKLLHGKAVEVEVAGNKEFKELCQRQVVRKQ